MNPDEVKLVYMYKKQQNKSGCTCICIL